LIKLNLEIDHTMQMTT